MQTSRIFFIALVVVTAQAGFSQAISPNASQPIPHLTLTFTTIDCTPGAAYTTATGINNAGEVVGTCAGTNGLQGYEWTPKAIRHFDFPGAAFTGAADINSQGEIAGIYNITAGSTTQGFLLNKGTYTTIDVREAPTIIIGINATGEIAGYWNDKNSTNGFLYGKGIFHAISIPGQLYTIPNGLNSSAVVGIYSTSGTVHAFLLQGSILTTLDFPGAVFSFAYSINTCGEVIGLYEDNHFLYHGFLWLDGSFVATFDLQGGAMVADVFTRLSLNDMGQIVGTYIDSKVARHGFVAKLPTGLGSARGCE